ncbi:hypothetical protein pdam_00015076 [Paramuricea clavata]|uniref:Uncharacterized protein n=1 Tax=Paramuricea clavata TaxID=317549 RepID=A0A6S7HA17_PARCT|nr:hypothetical protein pdam_00015076 [Paramuricea clavata]
MAKFFEIDLISLSLLIFCSLVQPEETCKSSYFNKRYQDISRLKEDIISESRQRSLVHCGSSCSRHRFCIAYNYKENCKENETNCQLSDTTKHKFEKTSHGDNGWTFYGAVCKKMFIREDKECNNGGNLILDLDKCDCPDDFEGEHCETKISK